MKTRVIQNESVRAVRPPAAPVRSCAAGWIRRHRLILVPRHNWPPRMLARCAGG